MRILVAVLIIIVIIIMTCGNESHKTFLESTYMDQRRNGFLKENYKDLDDQCRSDSYKKIETSSALDTDYLKILKENGFNNAPKYMLVSDFSNMVVIISDIVLDMLMEYGSKCQSADGYIVRDRIEEHQKTLSCYNDLVDIEERIILKITAFIYSYIDKKFGIKLNPYYSINLMKIHLNLLESILYPLAYSSLYTEHGIQYFNEKTARDLIHTNLRIHDVLFTIISSRGIILIENVDNIV